MRIASRSIPYLLPVLIFGLSFGLRFAALQQSDYLMNIDVQNRAVQDLNWKAWDTQRRGDNSGVEVQKAK